MKIIWAVLFLVISLYCIWNNKPYRRKSLLFYTGKGLVGVFIAIIILGLFLRFLATTIPGFTYDAAGDLLEEIGGSFITVWGMRFLMVAMTLLFSRIMDFHKKYNMSNYQKFYPVISKVSPVLLLLMKCILSFGAALMLYGVWFTS